MATTIGLNAALCSLCGRCLDACPIPCFSFDEEETEILVDGEGCIVCRNCEEECLHDCITVESPYESTVGYF